MRDVPNRQPRRQGVVYGPVRQDGPGSRGGAIIGRILGLAVLVLAAGLLTIGAISFVGGRNASPTPRPTLAAARTAAPSLATLPPIASPRPSSSISPSASPDASPTEGPPATPPLISVGPGFVTFGTKVDRELKVIDPRTEFTEAERITWSAYLISETAGSSLRLMIIKSQSSAPGGERLIVDEVVSEDPTVAQIYVRRIRPERFLDGPGIYVVRYLRDDRLLAEGQLLITE